MALQVVLNFQHEVRVLRSKGLELPRIGLTIGFRNDLRPVALELRSAGAKHEKHLCKLLLASGYLLQYILGAWHVGPERGLQLRLQDFEFIYSIHDAEHD